MKRILSILLVGILWLTLCGMIPPSWEPGKGTGTAKPNCSKYVTIATEYVSTKLQEATRGNPDVLLANVSMRETSCDAKGDIVVTGLEMNLYLKMMVPVDDKGNKTCVEATGVFTLAITANEKDKTFEVSKPVEVSEQVKPCGP